MNTKSAIGMIGCLGFAAGAYSDDAYILRLSMISILLMTTRSIDPKSFSKHHAKIVSTSINGLVLLVTGIKAISETNSKAKELYQIALLGESLMSVGNQDKLLSHHAGKVLANGFVSSYLSLPDGFHSTNQKVTFAVIGYITGCAMGLIQGFYGSQDSTKSTWFRGHGLFILGANVGLQFNFFRNNQF